MASREGYRVTSFRLDKGRPVARMRSDGPSPPVDATGWLRGIEKVIGTTTGNNLRTGKVGTLKCGHDYYEPYVKHGRYVWCEECQHNREIKPKPKPTREVVSDQGEIPF